MEKINKLILCLLPNQICNLKCEYCYISQLKQWTNKGVLKYSVEHMAKCLSKERVGGTALINLTGEGETFLVPHINEIIIAFLKEGHYVEVVTNGTVKKQIEDLLRGPAELLSHLFFKISFHYKELVARNMLDSFFNTVEQIKRSSASFSVELMAYDEIDNVVEDIQRECLERLGALCHVTVGRNDTKKKKTLLSKHTVEEYRKIWNPFDSAMFGFKMDVLGVKRKEFCYAGAWSISLNLYTGETQPCYWQPYNQNIFEDIEKPIVFKPVGKACTLPYCYNAHAHMTWGVIPSIKTPTYCQMRNRVCLDGTEWLKPNCKNFFQTKLVDSNKQFNKAKEIKYLLSFPFVYVKWWLRDYKGNINRVKRILRRNKDG